MPPMQCSVSDGGVLASIFKMQKKALANQSKMMRRILDLETNLSNRITVTHSHTVKCDKWICPVCLRGFPEKDSLKGHVR
jgi:hypothetical protein